MISLVPKLCLGTPPWKLKLPDSVTSQLPGSRSFPCRIPKQSFTAIKLRCIVLIYMNKVIIHGRSH